MTDRPGDTIGKGGAKKFPAEFPHIYGCLVGTLKWGAFYALGFALAILFPVVMFGFALGFISASVSAAWEIGRARTASSTREGL